MRAFILIAVFPSSEVLVISPENGSVRFLGKVPEKSKPQVELELKQSFTLGGKKRRSCTP